MGYFVLVFTMFDATTGRMSHQGGVMGPCIGMESSVDYQGRVVITPSWGLLAVA